MPSTPHGIRSQGHQVTEWLKATLQYEPAAERVLLQLQPRNDLKTYLIPSFNSDMHTLTVTIGFQLLRLAIPYL